MEIIFKKSVVINGIENYLAVGYIEHQVPDKQYCCFYHQISKYSNFGIWFKNKPSAIMRDENPNLALISKENLIHIIEEKRLIAIEPELKKLFAEAINTIEFINKNEVKKWVAK